MSFDLDDQLAFDCFGEFYFSNDVCRAHCALRLPCAIERQNIHCLTIAEALAESDRFPPEKSH
jgi:hypothetical protein